MSLELIVGLGVAGFLFLYFAFNLSRDEEGKEQHFLLKLLLIFFFIFTLNVLPKATLDARTVCEPVVTNTTVNGAVTTYAYTTQCTTSSDNTPVTFLKIAQWFTRIFAMYFLLFLFWHWCKTNETMIKMIDGVKKQWTGKND